MRMVVIKTLTLALILASSSFALAQSEMADAAMRRDSGEVQPC